MSVSSRNPPDELTFVDLHMRKKEPKKIKAVQLTKFQRIVHSPAFKWFVAFIAISIFVPIIVYYVVYDVQLDVVIETETCLVENGFRVPCGVVNISSDACNRVRCCFDILTDECFHYLPSKYNYGGSVDSSSPSEDETPYEEDMLKNLKISVFEQDENRLQITIHDPSETHETNKLDSKNYQVDIKSDPVFIEVRRKDEKTRVLTTEFGPLIASKTYWEWTVDLNPEYLYGLSQLLIPYNETITKVIYKNKVDAFTTPRFMSYSQSNFHGLTVDNDGPLEVIVTKGQLVVLRSLSGSRITLNLVLGPTPKDVRSQLLSDSPKVLPPYWTLGPHICRDGLTSIESTVNEVTEFYQNNEINFQSDCIHENLYLMTVEEEGVEESLNPVFDLLGPERHFLMTLPPQVKKDSNLHNEALKLDILYKTAEGETLFGQYLENTVSYPDFSNPDVKSWVTGVLSAYPMAKAHGFVLKDNWPVEEKYLLDDTNFSYMTTDIKTAMSGTLPFNSTAKTTSQHQLFHNSYGQLQQKLMEELNYFTITSSHSGVSTVQLQTVDISWMALKSTFHSVLEHNILSQGLISVPVCGSSSKYNKETHETVCVRWYLNAATQPLFRITSDFPRRDPQSLNSKTSSLIAADAIKKREMIQPYMYTVLASGEPIIRPMFYSYFQDNVTLPLDEQYMIGDSLLVAQPFVDNLYKLRVYLPTVADSWYEFWGGMNYGNAWVEIGIVRDDWVMFIKSGDIIPMKNVADNSMMIGIALPSKCEDFCATGLMQVNKEPLTLTASATELKISNIQEALDCDDAGVAAELQFSRKLTKLKIYGLEETVKLLTLDFTLCDQGDELSIVYDDHKPTTA